jgi:xanthosine utilization system XapX-like protein
VTLLALGIGWYVGWAVGLVVVLIAASLLLTIIGLGRRLSRQAVEITEALEGTRAHTEALWQVRGTNAAVHRVTRGLAAARRMLTR